MSSPGFTIGDYRSYRRWHYRSYRRGAIGLSDTIGHYRSTIGVHYRTIGPGLKLCPSTDTHTISAAPDPLLAVLDRAAASSSAVSGVTLERLESAAAMYLMFALPRVLPFTK